MTTPGGPSRLSRGERARVAVIAIGFSLVLGSLAFIAVQFSTPAALLEAIPREFQAGATRRALGLCVTFVFYVAGLPVGLVLAFLALSHAATGRPSKLTRWVLRESRPPAEPSARVGLPPAVGWGVFFGILALMIALLIWAATRDG